MGRLSLLLLLTAPPKDWERRKNASADCMPGISCCWTQNSTDQTPMGRGLRYFKNQKRLRSCAASTELRPLWSREWERRTVIVLGDTHSETCQPDGFVLRPKRLLAHQLQPLPLVLHCGPAVKIENNKIFRYWLSSEENTI